MSLHFALSDRAEARIVAAAAYEGIDPTLLLEKLVEQYLPPIETNGNELGDFGGLSIAEAFPELIGAVSGESTDMAAHPEKYMQGFGETRNRRTLP